MVKVQEGQCGLCDHFGEHEASGRAPEVLEILSTQQAPEALTEPCTQPAHKALHLLVTPVSGCDSFAPAH